MGILRFTNNWQLALTITLALRQILRCHARLTGSMHRRSHILQRITQILPCLIPAQQRTYAPNPQSSQLQRRTGAGGFVGSSTEQHDLAIARDLAVLFL